VNSAISPANQWQFIVDGKRRAVGVRPRIRVNCDRPIRALALAGYGIGLCLLPTVRGDVAAGRLVRLLEAYEAYDRVVYAIYPAQPAPSRQGARVPRPPGRPFPPQQGAEIVAWRTGGRGRGE
jgi:DNA-binding transcriptional LysR family regulator